MKSMEYRKNEYQPQMAADGDSGVDLVSELKLNIEQREIIAKKYVQCRHSLFLLFGFLAKSQNRVLQLQRELRKNGLNKEASALILYLPKDVEYWAACGMMQREDAEYYQSIMGKGLPSSKEFSKYWLERCDDSLTFGSDSLAVVKPDYGQLLSEINTINAEIFGEDDGLFGEED